jgi:ribonuclease P protein component
MKAKVEILRGFGAFTKVITEGKIYEEKPIRAFAVLSKAESSVVYVGFAISKSVKRAVDRNLLRRYMRESFRHQGEILANRVGKETAISIVFMYAGSVENACRGKGRLPSISKSMHKICEKMRTEYVEE